MTGSISIDRSIGSLPLLTFTAERQTVHSAPKSKEWTKAAGPGIVEQNGVPAGGQRSQGGLSGRQEV